MAQGDETSPLPVSPPPTRSSPSALAFSNPQSAIRNPQFLMTHLPIPIVRFNSDSGGVSGGDPAAAGSGNGAFSSSQHVSQPSSETGSTASAPWTWAKEDGSFNDGWAERLPEQIRGHASLKVIGSLPDLAKSYIETKAMIGKKLEAPAQNASPEQIAAWRKVVGAPDKLEGYYADRKSLRPDSIPEGLWDQKSEQRFVQLAHKHHLSPTAVKEILGFYGENVSDGLKASQQHETAHLHNEMSSLRQAWGREFDTNLHTAARVAQMVGLDPKSHPIFTSAEVVQAFARIGKLMSEDKLVTGSAGGILGSAADRIRDLTDPSSNSILAREYRGEFGAQRQSAAQAQYHQLLQSTSQY